MPPPINLHSFAGDIAVAKAAEECISLSKRSISPHTIRHTIAMHLLQSGVAFSVIALWLGHESMDTQRLVRFFRHKLTYHYH